MSYAKQVTLLFAVCCIIGCSCYAQYVPPNIDFEIGTTGFWTFYTGTCCPGPGGAMDISTVTPPINGRHTLVSGATTDIYGGFPIVSPTGGSYSIRLGYDTSGNRAERCRYYVHIPASAASYSLIYHYAMVMENPAGHGPTQEPRMEIKAFDSATGVVVACDSYLYISSSSLPGFTLSPVGSNIYYRSWSSGRFVFNSMAGRTVAVDFAAGDCGLGGHWGYGYADMSPGLFISLLDTCSMTSISDTIRGPEGYASYVWCDAATFTTTYGTSRNLGIAATSGSISDYALILTPYPGYGCTDTLVSRIIVRAPCSGVPAIGTAYASRASVCYEPDTLMAVGYSSTCGLSYQWQYSPDNVTWYT